MGIQYDPTQRDVFGTTKVNNEYTIAQTNTEIVAGVSGKVLVIDYLMVSADATGTFLLAEGGSTVFGKVHLIAGVPLVMANPDIKFSSGEGIDVTTTNAGNHTVWIEYHEE